MTNIALIDADELAYKISLLYQKKFYTVLKDDKVLWRCPYKEDAVESIGNRDDLEIGETIDVYEPLGAQTQIDQFISSICHSTNSSSFKLYLSGDNNFRYERATLLPYKGGRQAKPLHYPYIESLFREMGATSNDLLEADDLLSINSFIYPNSIIASTDKDLRTVPSLNFNISKGKLSVISEEEANYNFFYQLLIGDSVDNIPSPYGLGEIAATKFLETIKPNFYENYYQVFQPFYQKYLNRKDRNGEYKTSWYKEQDINEILNEIGDLLWMRRTLDPKEKWK